MILQLPPVSRQAASTHVSGSAAQALQGWHDPSRNDRPASIVHLKHATRRCATTLNCFPGIALMERAAIAEEMWVTDDHWHRSWSSRFG